VPRDKVNYPRRNFVNHIQFKPEKKERIVTFSARQIAWKNPYLALEAILKILPYVDENIVFYIMGKGKFLKHIQREIKNRSMETRIKAFFCYDPSTIVNKSIIHSSIEQYDNFTNQTLLEGMASGCAIISTDVGLTKKIVTPNIGILVGLSSEEISNAIMNLLKNPDKIKQMGLNAREKIIREHNVEMYIDYISKVQDFDSEYHIINGKETILYTSN
jgi:glycosyltransferase involved in cell wall biosynthesis